MNAAQVRHENTGNSGKTRAGLATVSGHNTSEKETDAAEECLHIASQNPNIHNQTIAFTRDRVNQLAPLFRNELCVLIRKLHSSQGSGYNCLVAALGVLEGTVTLLDSK